MTSRCRARPSFPPARFTARLLNIWKSLRTHRFLSQNVQPRRGSRCDFFVYNVEKQAMLDFTSFPPTHHSLCSGCNRIIMEGTTVSKPRPEDRKPVVLITIGMAGSGKTTFVQRLNSYLRSIPPVDSRSHPSKPSSSGHDGTDGLQVTAASSSATAPGSTPPSATEPRAPYIVNLDPAVTYMPFDANIDIRDTIDYAEVMKQ